MEDQEINIKIAKACGWTDIHYLRGLSGGHLSGIKTPLRGWMPIPDYCNDLNAMHEAEKIFTKLQKNIYSGFLMGKFTYALFATARQRAEAFVKTIEK